MSSYVVTPLDPIPESPPAPQPVPLSTRQLHLEDELRGLSAWNPPFEIETYEQVDHRQVQYAKVNRAAHLRLETPTALRPIARKSYLTQDSDAARPLQNHSTNRRWSSNLDALDLDSGRHLAAMNLTYEPSDMSDLRVSRKPPGHLSAFERTPRSSVELARRRTSSGVSSTSSKRDQFLPPALLSPVAISTGSEPTFDVYARKAEPILLGTSSLPDQSASPASPFGVTTALSVLRRLSGNSRNSTCSREPAADETASNIDSPPSKSQSPLPDDPRLPSTAENSHPSRQASSQSDEHVRVSGTFGVRDSFPSAAGLPRGAAPPPDRSLCTEWHSEMESEEDLHSEGMYGSPESPGGPIGSSPGDLNELSPHEPAAENDVALKQRRRDTFIVGNYAGLALAEAQAGKQQASTRDDPSIASDRWSPQGTLREIFPGSDWKLIAPPGHEGVPQREQDASAARQFPVGGARAHGARLPSLTESEFEAVPVSHTPRASADPGLAGPVQHEGVSPRQASTPQQRTPPTATLTEREQTSDTALLVASAILSQLASIMLKDVNVQQSEARKLRQMAHEALDAGRLLLEIVGTDDLPGSKQHTSGTRASQRQAAFEALTSRMPTPFRIRSRSPTLDTSPRSRDSLHATDPRAYRAPSTAMLNARAVPRARSSSLPGDLLSDVERLSRLGWDKMHEAEAAWQQMIDVLRENMLVQMQVSLASASPLARAPSPRISKLRRRSASPALGGAGGGVAGGSRPRPILSPTASMRRSESDSTSRPSQQVRFAEAVSARKPRKPRKRWFSFLRRRPATVFEPVTAPAPATA